MQKEKSIEKVNHTHDASCRLWLGIGAKTRRKNVTHYLVGQEKAAMLCSIFFYYVYYFYYVNSGVFAVWSQLG